MARPLRPTTVVTTTTTVVVIITGADHRWIMVVIIMVMTTMMMKVMVTIIMAIKVIFVIGMTPVGGPPIGPLRSPRKSRQLKNARLRCGAVVGMLLEHLSRKGEVPTIGVYRRVATSCIAGN